MVAYSQNTSPVGWYIGSYLLRFIELDSVGNDDPNAEFLAWENTIIVRASDLDEAYGKVISVAETATGPYKGGTEGIPVQWVFEGVTELLPIYEELEDGAEIMWAEHDSIKLSVLRRLAKPLSEFKQQLDDKCT